MSRACTMIATFLAAVVIVAPAHAAPEDYALKRFSAEVSTDQAGGHPDVVTEVATNTDPDSATNGYGFKMPYAATRDIAVELPPGLSGNPTAVDTCTAAQLFSTIDSENLGECPRGSQVGTTFIAAYEEIAFLEPVYMMDPPGGDVVARLGFIAGLFPTYLDLRLDPARDYAVTATVSNASRYDRVIEADTTIWGVPADPSHDRSRQTPLEAFQGKVSSVPRPPGGPPLAFMNNSTRCGVGSEATASARSWERPDLVSTLTDLLPPLRGCDRLDFDSTVSLRPTSRRTAAASGIEFQLRVDQDSITDPGGLTAPHVKAVKVTLPEGVTINASAADGLEGCTSEQIGVVSKAPVRFDAAEPACPEASKIGAVEVTTPVLDEQLVGYVYQAAQGDNPFGTLLAGYIVVRGPGVLVKLAGRFELDSRSGRITAVFDNNPQQPFSVFTVRLNGGPRAVVRTPDECGTYTSTVELRTWAHPGTPMTLTNSFVIDEGCDAEGFNPTLNAGAHSPFGGAHSPFFLQVKRTDNDQEISGLDVRAPEGLTAVLRGIAQCPESALSTFPNPPVAGQGAGELASPACPAASQVGKVIVGAGAGTNPFYVDTGKVYLAGPYRGAPLSFAFVTPAVAGPFDLGNVLVRTAAHVDPVTAQVTAKADPLPTILHGIPLDLRDVRVNLDRPGFMLNPTSCKEKSIDASLTSTQGATANPKDRFQLAECSRLGFKPKLTLRLRGGTKRADHPALTATLRNRSGDANIASVVTAFPPSEFLENAHIRTVCTRADFAASNCPAGAIYGTATVWTPLFDEPLTGNVYLRSSSNLLPDLVPDLRGPASLPVRIEAAGRTDSVNGGIRNSFDQIPDAPFSKLVLKLQGGRKGLLVNSRDVCKHTYRATVRMTGHNGRRATLRPALRADCGKKGKKGKAKRSSHHRAKRVG